MRFADLQRLVEAYGFRLDRVRGSHHIYVHPDIPDLVNLQDVKGKAKPYQMKQFLAIIERFNLPLRD